MKKIVASVGLLALGASGLHAASVPSVVAPDTKPWTIAATLRGFYDDNFNSAPDDASLRLTRPDGTTKSYARETWGFEISPSVMLNLPINEGQTGLNLGYTYSYKWYDDKPYGSTDNNDQTHQFFLGFDHSFSERYALSIKDTFVIGQDPDMLRVGNAMETFQRIDGDNIRNHGAITFDGKATRLFGYQLGYANSYFNYDDDGETTFLGDVTPSISGLLDRMEHVGRFDTRWQVQPDTVAVVGYQYRQIDYSADEAIAGNEFGDVIYSDDRNSRSHYGYIGADHSFRPDFTGSLRVGAKYTDYEAGSDSDVNPYVLASLRYNYLPESFVEVGYTLDINATDMIGYQGNSGDFTKDQESSVVYLTLTHRITPRLFASLNGQFQNSEFNGGMYDGESENFYSAGISLEYRFNRNFSTHVGYSYDRLNSDLGDSRDFDRNRVYVGLTARY